MTETLVFTLVFKSLWFTDSISGNKSDRTVDWQFITVDAWLKLKRLYPQF
ncbi:hypothetical protein [Nostoc sp.]